jgi:membrane protein YqaA with SNARE-associated domain
MLHGEQAPTVEAPPMERPRGFAWSALWSLLGTVALTALLIALPVDVERWGAYGYAGTFVLTLLSSATVLVPSVALGAALRFGTSTALDPILVGLVAGIAAGLGECTGYIAGRSGAELARFEERPSYRRIARWVARRGTLTVLLLAAIPLPLIDLAGLAAGAIRMPFWRFEAACITGKILRFVPVALLGRWLHGQGWL